MTSRLRVACGLAIIAAVTLMLELVLIRAFDAMMNAEMSHLIITCAMFSFGLSGVYASLRPLPKGANPERVISNLAIGFGVFTLLLLPLLNLNPFNYSELTTSPGRQALYFALMYVTLMIPFFLAGLIFTTVFSSYASSIRTLYCFDLCGAAVGSVMFIPFIPALGPGGLLFQATALSFLAAVLFAGKLERTEGLVLAVAVAVAVGPFLHGKGYIDFTDHEDKREVKWAKENDRLETTRWDPVAKIEIVQPRPREGVSYSRKDDKGRSHELYKHVAYDGGEQSSRFYRFDGNFARLRKQLRKDPKLFVEHFWNRSVIAAHWFRADSDSEVLIIGSAGGQETKAALLYKPRSVDTVEMVSAVVDLAQNEYNDYIGGIFRDPRVHAHVGEGRTFLRRADRQFDIIQIFSNHTSSSMAGGGGPGRGVYLQTVEAYKEYFTSLKPDGLLQVNHHFYPRIIATASAAWKELGRGEFRRHVLVYERRILDTTPLLLFKMTPWTAPEVELLSSLMLDRRAGGQRDRFRLVEDPTNPTESVLSDEFYSGALSPELVARVPYRITPPTDNQPYFNFVRKRLGKESEDPKNFVSLSIAGMLNAQMTDGGKAAGMAVNLPQDIAHYVLSSAVAVVFAILFVLAPLVFGSGRRERWSGDITSLFYFGCLGAGFIIIELTLAPVFMKLIGIPLYTYSTVIFTMLAAAGVGSHAATALKITPNSRWWVPYTGTLVSGALLLLTYASMFDQFLASPLLVRVAVAACSVFPISFFMGMCLPLGVLALEHKPPSAIAWAWGMNGLFTTIGGLAAAFISMVAGFRVTLVVALAVYALAGLAFVRLRRLTQAADARAPDEPTREVLDLQSS